MKLATKKNNTRDGRLIVVSSDNTRYAAPQVQTMQQALPQVALLACLYSA